MFLKRSLVSLANVTFADIALFILVAATVRQYAWIIPSDLAAWLVTGVFSLALLFMHLHLKDVLDAGGGKPDKRYLGLIWIFLVVLYLMRVSLPDLSFDVLGYHLTAAERSMHGFPYRPGDFFPSGLVTPPPTPDMFLAIFRSLFGYRLGTIGNLLILIWTVEILDRFLTTSSLPIWEKILALMFIILCEDALFLLDTYMVDLIALPLLLESTWILYNFKNIIHKRYSVYFCSFLLGMSFALKLTNLAFVIPLMVWLMIMVFHYRRALMLSTFGFILTSVLAGIVFMAPILPFSIFMYRQTANPIFPFYNAFFQSPYWPTINFRDNRWGGTTLGRTLIWPVVGSFMPERLSELHALAKHYSGRLALSEIVCLLGLLYSDSRIKRIILVWLAGSILWSFSTGYARYTIYLEILGGLLIVFFLIELQSKMTAYPHATRKLFLLFYAVLISGCLFQSIWAIKLTLRYDWALRSTIYREWSMHAKNIRYLFHDRNLNDFLDGKTGALLATADAWAVASPATSAYATQTNSTIPVINIEENTFIATLKARKQFAKTMCLVRNKRILTICDEFNLNLCTYNILNRGFKVRELTNVPFSYYGQDFIGYVFAIQQNDEYHPSKALDMAKTAATGPLPHEAFNAEISLKTSKIDTKRDRLFSIPISIRNASAYVWPSLKSSGGMDRVVAISYHITDSDNNMVVSDGIRSLLLYDVKPGQRIDQNAIVRSPEQPGRYIVEIDMIQQGVAWFANKRKSPVKCRINVF